MNSLQKKPHTHKIKNHYVSITRSPCFCFYYQGMITIVLECIDRLNVYNTAAHFSEFAGEEAAESWKEIVNLLYELLGRRVTVEKHKLQIKSSLCRVT